MAMLLYCVQGSRTDFLQLMLNAKNDQPDEDGEVYKASSTTNTANHGNGHKSERSSTNTWDKKGNWMAVTS